MFTVSVQFLPRASSWFDVRVEARLDRGLSLGRNALDYLLTDLDYKSPASGARAERNRR